MENMKWYIAGDATLGILGKYSIKAMLDVGHKTAAVAFEEPGGARRCMVTTLPYLGTPEVVSQCVKDAFTKEGLAPAQKKAKENGMNVDGPSCSRSGDLDV